MGTGRPARAVARDYRQKWSVWPDNNLTDEVAFLFYVSSFHHDACRRSEHQLRLDLKRCYKYDGVCTIRISLKCSGWNIPSNYRDIEEFPPQILDDITSNENVSSHDDLIAQELDPNVAAWSLVMYCTPFQKKTLPRKGWPHTSDSYWLWKSAFSSTYVVSTLSRRSKVASR